MTIPPRPTRIGVIMAGGSGERFWPLSRFHHPKQLLALTGTGRSLLAESVQRLQPCIPRDRIFVATSRHLVEAIREAGVVPPENVWAEPCKRNTAGCLIYAAAECLTRFPEAAEELAVAVVTADHWIGAPERFTTAVEKALAVAEAEPALATIGIAPTRPETGYGYVEIAADAKPLGTAAAEPPVFPVARFREKPDRNTAEAFIHSGRFFWNSGMFFWRVGTFLRELERARPEMARVARDLTAPLSTGDSETALRVFETLEDISIDYALMERARRVVMVRGDFPWDDVGSWDALERFLDQDEAGNSLVGDAVVLDSRNCIVYNQPGDPPTAVGVLGAQDLIVVATRDAVLVLPKDRSQEVRRIVAELRQRGAGQV